MTCNHDWRWIETWEGDLGVIGGTREVTYWRCSKCWAEDHQREAPDDERDDENDWMGDEP